MINNHLFIRPVFENEHQPSRQRKVVNSYKPVDQPEYVLGVSRISETTRDFLENSSPLLLERCGIVIVPTTETDKNDEDLWLSACRQSGNSLCAPTEVARLQDINQPPLDRSIIVGRMAIALQDVSGHEEYKQVVDLVYGESYPIARLTQAS